MVDVLVVPMVLIATGAQLQELTDHIVTEGHSLGARVSNMAEGHMDVLLVLKDLVLSQLLVQEKLEVILLQVDVVAVGTLVDRVVFEEAVEVLTVMASVGHMAAGQCLDLVYDLKEN